MVDYNEFQLYLARSGRKPSTIGFYLASLAKAQKEVPTLSLKDLQVWLDGLFLKGAKGTYLNNLVCFCRVLAAFRGEKCEMRLYPAKEFIKATMSDEEIAAFLALPPVSRKYTSKRGKVYSSCTDPTNYNKWTLFFSIMAFTGMRCGEVASLTVNTVDFGRGIFILEDTKTNTPRNVPIPPNIKSNLEQYISSLKGQLLFPSSRGGLKGNGVVDSVDWHYNFHTRIKRLGIKRNNLSPYSLRHSLITRLLEEDVNLFKVQKLVGHKKIETTAHYTHLTTKDLVATVAKHPLVRRSASPQDIMRALVDAIKAFEIDKDMRFKTMLLETSSGVEFRVELK